MTSPPPGPYNHHHRLLALTAQSKSTVVPYRLDDRLLQSAIAGFLAFKHFKTKNDSIVKDLKTILLESSCSSSSTSSSSFIELLELEMRDTRASPLEAVDQLVDAMMMIQQPQPQQNNQYQQEESNNSTLHHQQRFLQQQQSSSAPNTNATNNNAQQQPATTSHTKKPFFAVFGASYSSVTYPLAVVASGGYELPIISGAATSHSLEQSDLLFGRTVLSDLGRAKAAVTYLKGSLGVTHLINLYEKNPYGAALNWATQVEAKKHGLKLLSVGYHLNDVINNNNPENIMETTWNILKQSEYRYVFAVFGAEWQDIILQAYDQQLIGPHTNMTWFAVKSIWSKPLRLDYSTTTSGSSNNHDNNNHVVHKLAKALHGTGGINQYVPKSDALKQAYQNFIDDPKLQQEFISKQYDKEAFRNYTFSYSPNFVNQYTMNEYDAMMTLAITACRSQQNQQQQGSSNYNGHNDHVNNTNSLLYNGKDFFDTMKSVQFLGASGMVSFDPQTGSRNPDTMHYGVYNWVLQNETTITTTTSDGSRSSNSSNYYYFDSRLSATIINGAVNLTNKPAYVYADNSTNVPASLPPLQISYNYNTLPAWALGVGYSLATILAACSLFSTGWTYYYQNKQIVKAAQPFFLVQISLGTLILSLAIVPLGAADDSPEDDTQQPQQQVTLDWACMATPWLFFCGLSLALSALIAKSWRLNKIFHAASRMSRVQIKPGDVMLPLAVLMTINITLLICWTLLSPYRFERVPSEYNLDAHGRSLESTGQCVAADDDNPSHLYFLVPLALVDFIGTFFAAYQYYKGRHLPIEFSESHHLLVSTASLLETVLIGAPILVIAREDKTAYFLVFSLLVFAVGMSILFPIFAYKMASLHSRQLLGPTSSKSNHSQPISRISFGVISQHGHHSHHSQMDCSHHSNHSHQSNHSLRSLHSTGGNPVEKQHQTGTRFVTIVGGPRTRDSIEEEREMVTLQKELKGIQDGLLGSATSKTSIGNSQQHNE